MEDEIILEALKEAIVRGFFTQQSYYDSQRQQQVYYGGEISQVVQIILSSNKIKKIIESSIELIKKDLKKNLIDIEKQVEKGLLKEVSRKVDDIYLEDLDIDIKGITREIIEKRLETDENLKKIIEKKIGKGKYDLEISVRVLNK